MLPYRFEDESLLELALTHASTGAEANNERLEFLGDTVLDLIVAEDLFRSGEELTEGDLSELKAWVVSRRVLAEAARYLQLEALANVGSGMKNRALPRSVLANLYEAVLGAVYLDGGLEAARTFTVTSLSDQLEQARRQRRGPNPKQALQQRAQASCGDPPVYAVIGERGNAHARAFLVEAQFGGRSFPSAWGRTRKEAEGWAAYEALLVLDAEGEA